MKAPATPKLSVYLVAMLTVFSVASSLTAAAQTATGFGNAPPSSVDIKITGCTGAGNNTVPVLPTTNNAYGTLLTVCPDTDYGNGSGNLGKVWNELDLVPFRLTTSNKANGGTVIYSVIIAGEFVDNAKPGWDVIGSDGANNGGPSNGQSGSTFTGGPSLKPGSDATCSATWDGYFTNGPGVSGSTSAIYRVIDITQGPGTTCVWDYYMRLALGSHLYPGSSLHGFTFSSADFSQGAQDVPLPVNQFGAQELAKNMNATQNSDHMWTITKKVSAPNGLDTCSTTANTQNVTITINWTKMAATPTGPITVVTNINATNQADRDIFVAVNDNIYIGSGQTTLLGSATNVNNPNPLNVSGTITVVGGTHGVLVPAHSNNYAVLQDVQVDPTTTDTQYNDVATATYFDPITQIAIPGSTTATASTTTIQSGSTLDNTASIEEVEGTRDSNDSFNLLNFSVTGHTDASGGSYENGYVEPNLAPSSTGLTCSPIDQVISGTVTSVAFPYCIAYQSGTLSSASSPIPDSGTLTFTKSITSTKQGAVTTGVLGDMAKLTTTDTQVVVEAEASAAISADATVALTINKTISNSANVTFTFHVYDLSVCAPGPVLNSSCEVFGHGNTTAPTISFTSGKATTNSVTINVPPSNYDVTEDAVTGWSQSAGTPNPQNADLRPVNGVAPCTGSVSFSNTEAGHIIVKKVTVPSSDTTTQFTFTPSYNSGTTFDLTNGGTPNDSGSLAPGSYTVDESGIAAGWNFTNVKCVSSLGTSSSTYSTTTASITLAAGDTVTCTYTNTEQASIVIRKKTIGDVGTFTYTTDLTGGTPVAVAGGSFTLTTAAQNTFVSETFSNATPGSYTVTESGPPAGWNFTSLSCSVTGTNGSTGTASGQAASITLNPGDTVTCDYTNTKQASIVIRKKTIGDVGTFTYTTDLTGGTPVAVAAGAFTITTATQNTFVSETFSNAAPGSYTVTESGPPAGWNFSSLSCSVTGTNGSTGTPNGQAASITLAAGDTVTCDYTNTKQASIVIRKKTIGDIGTFTYTTDLTGGTPVAVAAGSFTITTATQNTFVSETFSNAAPGSYTVTESGPPAGWNFSSLSCSVTGTNGSTGTPSGQAASIKLVAGDTVTCDYTNTKQASIVIRKKTIGDVGTFTYTTNLTGGTPVAVAVGSFTITTATQNTFVSETFSNAAPGAYTVTESGPPTGWSFTSLSCSVTGTNGSTGVPTGQAASITLVAGDSVTCDYTNTKQGQIEVIKDTLPTTANGTFNYTDNFGVSSLTTVGGTANTTSGYLTPGNGYSLTEQTPNNGKTGFTQISDTCATTGITVTAGQTTTCTFTNATAFVKVIKTVNGGAIPLGLSFPFSLYINASTTSTGTLLEGPLNATSSNSTLNFTTKLIPGQQYEMCESLGAFNGWSVNFGTFSLFNPSGDNSTWCAYFTPTAGTTSVTTINVNNMPPPGGMAFTIGYWKNWSSCTGGGQKHSLDLTLYHAQSTLLPWTGAVGPGIAVGDLALYTSPTADPDAYCRTAVEVLSKSSASGKNFSSSPAYNMAAQLLGAELNIVGPTSAGGSGYNACTISLIQSGNKLLTAVKFAAAFAGNKAPTMNNTQATDANYIQTQLNNYNNNLPYSCNPAFLY